MRIHLIGIGGTGMGALAGLLVEAGHEVRGSDGPLYPPMSTLLTGLGVPLFEGYRAENLAWGPELVVVGNICREDHPEARAAEALGLRRVSFPELLGEMFLAGREPLVVAGTHGKTTTTTMAVHVLHTLGLDPGFLVGGIPRGLGRSHGVGSPPHFVVEGDEYDCAFFDKRPKFVHYRPHVAILTGVEFDHADIYPTMADVERAFSMLVARVPPRGRILVCGHSDRAVRLCREARCPVERYSTRAPADWGAEVTVAGPAAQHMVVTRQGKALAELVLPMGGRHNADNALGVVAALCGHWGLEPAAVARALASFGGVKRRQEVRGRAGGVTVVDDFAHHPTAIRETLDGLRAMAGEGRLVAAFEPRSATSRRAMFQEAFAEALGHADRVVLAPLHDPSGIPEAERLNLNRLVADLNQGGTPAAVHPGAEAMAAALAGVLRPGDLVAVMSSGGFGGLHEKLLEALGGDHEP